MGRRNPEGRKAGFRNLEGDHGGIISYHKVLSASVHQPGIGLLQFGKACVLQHFPETCRCVEGCGRLLREVQKLLQTVHFIILLYFR